MCIITELQLMLSSLVCIRVQQFAALCEHVLYKCTVLNNNNNIIFQQPRPENW